MPEGKSGSIAAVQSHWLHHDWQQSVFAPGLRCVQALTAGNKTASGAGVSRHDAMMRCLGETAEIIAMDAHSVEHSEGIAAGPDIIFASYKALCERLERWAVYLWWKGDLEAKLSRHPEIEKRLTTLRNGANHLRITDIWMVKGFGFLKVAICLSTNVDGSRPILGFGADICPISAANSAITENALMELNLPENGPNIDLSSYFMRVLAKKPALFPAKISSITPEKALHPAQRLAQLEERMRKERLHYSLQDLTTPDTGLVVVRAIINDVPGLAGIENRQGPLL